MCADILNRIEALTSSIDVQPTYLFHRFQADFSQLSILTVVVLNNYGARFTLVMFYHILLLLLLLIPLDCVNNNRLENNI